MAIQTVKDERTNGGGDPVASDVLDADDQATAGRRAPADTGVGIADTAPAPQTGIYVPPSMDPGDTPIAADTDPSSTASADETGQGGNVWEDGKRKALDWNG